MHALPPWLAQGTGAPGLRAAGPVAAQGGTVHSGGVDCTGAGAHELHVGHARVTLGAGYTPQRGAGLCRHINGWERGGCAGRPACMRPASPGGGRGRGAGGPAGIERAPPRHARGRLRREGWPRGLFEAWRIKKRTCGAFYADVLARRWGAMGRALRGARRAGRGLQSAASGAGARSRAPHVGSVAPRAARRVWPRARLARAAAGRLAAARV